SWMIASRAGAGSAGFPARAGAAIAQPIRGVGRNGNTMTDRVGLRRWQGVLLGAAVVLALVLWVRQAATSLVFDEYASLYFSDQPFSRLWG
ncbi:hypothetical protein ABTL55_19290, partial [Acinetobacter baumannii]